MRLSERQIRRIIAESYGDMNDPYNPDADPNLVQREMSDWYTDRDETFADMKYRLDKEEDEELDAHLDDVESLQPDDYERLPKSSGMRRRNESVVRFTREQLRSIILEMSDAADITGARRMDYPSDDEDEINPYGTGNERAEPDNHGIGHT